MEAIYDEEVKEKISGAFQGLNSCYLLFGPNNSGKSYTLIGSNENGILDKSAKDLFNLIEITHQVNSKSRILFSLKMSIYIVFNDRIYDLSCKNCLKPLQLNKLFNLQTNNLITDISDLQETNLKNYNDYRNLIKEALLNRKSLEKFLNVKDLKKKSNLIISFIISKKEITPENHLISSDQKISQVDFVELLSSNYGNINNSGEENEAVVKSSIETFKSLNNNLECLRLKKIPEFESTLTLSLKKTLNSNTDIVFINCVHSNEDPPNESFQSLKV